MEGNAQAARTSWRGHGQGYCGAFLWRVVNHKADVTRQHERNSPIVHRERSSSHFPGYDEWQCERGIDSDVMFDLP